MPITRYRSTDIQHSVASLEAKANVCCVKFNPSSCYHLAFGSADHCVHYYDLRYTKQPLNVFKGHKKAVSYVKFLNKVRPGWGKLLKKPHYVAVFLLSSFHTLWNESKLKTPKVWKKENSKLCRGRLLNLIMKIEFKFQICTALIWTQLFYII